MLQNQSSSVKDQLSSITDELSQLERITERTPEYARAVRLLGNRVRKLILTTTVYRQPLVEEARQCSDILNRLNRLRREC